jgi:salicylate hydroxylase
LVLAQKGFRSVVLEQVAEFGEAGVGEQVKRRALLIERMAMFDTVTGNEVVNIECGAGFRARVGNPYAVAHRADVHAANDNPQPRRACLTVR